MDNNLLTCIQAVPSKAQIECAVREYVDRFENGEVNDPIKEYIGLKAMQSFIEDALKQTAKYAIDDADKYTKQELAEGIWGATVQLKNAPVKFDYSHSEEWANKDAEVQAYKDQMKMAENERKAIEKNMELAKTAIPVVGTGARTISIILQK